MGEVNGIKSLGVALLMAGMEIHAGALAAQEVKHLNPVIEKLAAGKAIIGFQTGDLTLGNARTMSPADVDYVYVDMEHTPLDFPGLNQFAMGMVDKATALKKNSPTPNVALFARFPPYGREGAQWIAKQALDAGLMGVIFNGVDTPEQALVAVQTCATRKSAPRSTRIRPDCAVMVPPLPHGCGAPQLQSTSTAQMCGR
jgi:2-keto-3-deoxy-L-rhamnonate aldolase RhmA